MYEIILFQHNQIDRKLLSKSSRLTTAEFAEIYIS